MPPSTPSSSHEPRAAALLRHLPALGQAEDAEQLLASLWEATQALFDPEGLFISFSHPQREKITWVHLRREMGGFVKTVRSLPALEAGPGALERLPEEWVGTIESGLSAPLLAQGRPVGTIFLLSSAPSVFTEFDQPLLEALAVPLALALQTIHLAGEVQQRLGELKIIQQATLQLTSNLELQAVLDAIVHALFDFFDNIKNAHIFLYNEESQRLTFGAALWSDGRQEIFSEPRKDGLTYQVARQGEAIIVPNMREHPLFQQTPWTWAIIGLPLKFRGRVVGVMNIAFHDTRTFPEAELELLRLLADQAAIAIENARVAGLQAEQERTRLEKKLAEQRALELEALYQASLQLTSNLDPKAVLDAIVETTLSLLSEVQDAHIFLYREGRLTFGSAVWSDGRRGTTFSEPREDGMTYQVARQGEAIIVPDLQEHPLFQQTSWKGAIIGLPLKFRGQVVGVMNVAFEQPRTFSKAELDLLRLLAEQAAIAIENARLYELVVQQNASKDKFFSIISHDLRSPFNGLLGFAQVLHRYAQSMDAAEVQDCADRIYAAGKHILTLLNNLLDWARMQTGHMEFQPREVELQRLTEGVVDLLRSIALSKEIYLANEVEQGALVYADPNMLETVIRNLLSNALKFTHPGGRVHLSARRWQGVVEVKVSDTGVGMSAEVIQKLFRIDVTHTTRGTAQEGGTGLGLILCKELIEKNGGQIRVESSPGKGSSFCFTLPQRGRQEDRFRSTAVPIPPEAHAARGPSA